MRNRTIIVTLALAALLASALPVLAAADTDAALDYLTAQQNADGGFGSGFSPDSTVGSTADAVLAIVAVEGDPATFDSGGSTPVSYLAVNASSAATGGDLAKLILAVIAIGENPREFGGVDSVTKLESMLAAGGKIGGEMDTLVGHSLAILALKSALRPVPAEAIDYVKNAQQESGAWAWDGSAETASDTNTTAFAVQALVAADGAASSDAVSHALAYYKAIQNEDGGWPYQNPSDYGTATDTNSTAVTIQALLAANQDPFGPDWATAEGSTPLSALEALQNESGAFAWQAAVPDDNLLATVQALPAVAGQALPLATMAVGEATTMAPATIPATGGGVANLMLPLILSGLALVGGGCALHRRR
ncbi:prenyltransferase/squalene oxidase repeat-containing protein [Chloroflexota bacterium]